MVVMGKVRIERVKAILKSVLHAMEDVTVTCDEIVQLAYAALEGRRGAPSYATVAEPIDPKIVAAIKDRDSRTDRYGDDLVFQVDHDLRDHEYVARWMPERHREGCRLFAALPEDERFRILREVLDEPEPGRGYGDRDD